MIARRAREAAARAARVLVLAAAALAAAPVAEAGRLVSESFASPALGRAWDYNVYLPDGHETGTLRYPALYLLHGGGADRHEWVAKGDILRTADALIAAGAIPPCLVVMPSAGASWYVDRQEAMETALVRDLLPAGGRRAGGGDRRLARGTRDRHPSPAVPGRRRAHPAGRPASRSASRVAATADRSRPTRPDSAPRPGPRPRSPRRRR